jgi:hypothetical protein
VASPKKSRDRLRELSAGRGPVVCRSAAGGWRVLREAVGLRGELVGDARCPDGSASSRRTEFAPRMCRRLVSRTAADQEARRPRRSAPRVRSRGMKTISGLTSRRSDKGGANRQTRLDPLPRRAPPWGTPSCRYERSDRDARASPCSRCPSPLILFGSIKACAAAQISAISGTRPCACAAAGSA